MSTRARVRLYVGLIVLAVTLFTFGLTVLGYIATAAWIGAMALLHDW